MKHSPKESSRQGGESQRPVNIENQKQLKRVSLTSNAPFSFQGTTAMNISGKNKEIFFPSRYFL